MKKIGVAAFVVFILAIIFAPFVNGIVLEKIITRSKDNLNEMYAETGSDVRIEILEYTRGFSTSEIDWRIDLGSLSALYGIDEILVEDRAKHGITGVASTTSLAKNPWFIDLIDNKLNGKNPVTITTNISLSGKIESILSLDDFVLNAGGKTIVIRPGRIVTQLDRNMNHFSSESSWGGLSLPDNVELDNVTMTYDLAKISTYIWEGEAGWHIGTLRMQDREKQTDVALQDFSGDYNLDFDRKHNLLSGGSGLNVADLAVDGERLTDAAFKMEMNNVDAPGYENFMNIYTKSTYAVLDDIIETGDDPEKLAALMQNKMAVTALQLMAAGEKLLKKGLQMKITDLHARTSLGKITGNLEVGLNRDITFAQLSPVLMQPQMALDIFSLASNLRVPAELAGENPTLVGPIYPGMQTGLFVRDGMDLVHNARTRDGKLFLNGNEVVFNPL